MTWQRERRARHRKRFQDRIVPEENLQQQRDVAQSLDIDGRAFRDNKIGRQARGADRKAQQARADNSDSRDQQRIEQADEKRAAICRGEGIGNQTLVDVEPGALRPEAEIVGNVMRTHMRQRHHRAFIDDKHENKNESDLDERVARRREAAFLPARHIAMRDQRTGGAY